MDRFLQVRKLSPDGKVVVVRGRAGRGEEEDELGQRRRVESSLDLILKANGKLTRCEVERIGAAARQSAVQTALAESAPTHPRQGCNPKRRAK